MIAQWMLHVLVVTALLGMAAAAGERVLRLWRREARMIWGSAVVLSVAIPMVSLAQALGLVPHFGASGTVAAPVAVLLAPIAVTASGGGVDLLLAAGWFVASLAVALRFVAATRGLEARRQTWRAATVDGESVLISTDAGPAVVGFRRPTIVVPEWVLGLDTSLRTLVLQHEREHRDRGD